MNVFLVTNKNFLENLFVVEIIFYDVSLTNTVENLREKNYIWVPTGRIIPMFKI